MKIRSVTSFINITSNGSINDNDFNKLASFIQEIKRELVQSEYHIQSLRCATNPFSDYLDCVSLEPATGIIQQLEQQLTSIGFDYISIGSLDVEHLWMYSWIPHILSATENVFATAQMVSSTQPSISIAAIKEIASIIHQLSRLEENGFGNLYFAGLACVPGSIPFLPAAYKSSDETELSFALAMESADLAVKAFSAAKNLQEAAGFYRDSIEREAARLERIISSIAAEYQTQFLGFDFTPAPYVTLESSCGKALEHLSGSPFGSIASLSAAAFLMSVLDTARFRRSGFNGLMLPILEDSVLAQRAADGTLTLKDLLLYSTVCGTGLDTVPLPGDISEPQLHSILLDVSSLAVRLNKPLTARLMPIPGKKAGEMTSFDFPFFTNSRVMSPECSGLGGLLGSSENFLLKPRL
jgi:uncharacterized protein (UPF0210 family)